MFAGGRTLVTCAIVVCLSGSVATLASANRGDSSSSASNAAASDGKKLFLSGTTPSCATCHALKDAGAMGNVGPDLDALKPSSERVARAVRDGFEAMPAFGAALSETQITAIARYVAEATGSR